MKLLDTRDRRPIGGAAAGKCLAVEPSPKQALKAIVHDADGCRPELQMEWLNLRDFGAKGDGLADNTEALLRAGRYMRMGRRQHYTLHVPPGEYLYQDNRWLMGIRSVAIEAAGATFVYDGYSNPLHAGMLDLLLPATVFEVAFQATVKAELARHGGTPFQLVEEDRRRIQLLDPLAVETFMAGHRVFLYGLDCEVPTSSTGAAALPTTRHAEWHRVAAVDHDTGTLLLENPAEYGYASDWPDNVWYGTIPVGRPRIIDLDQPGRLYPHHVGISGARFTAAAPAMLDRVRLNVPSSQLRLSHCRIDAVLAPYQNRIAVFERCRLRQVGGGAMCGTLNFDDCDIEGPVHQLGRAANLVVKCCRVGGRISLGARHSYFVGNTFSTRPAGDGNVGVHGIRHDHLISLAGSTAPIETLALRRNRVLDSPDLACVVDNGVPSQLVSCHANEFNELVVGDGERGRRVILSSIEAGVLLYRGDLGNYGHVRHVRHVDGEWRIAGDWSEPIQAGEAWYVFDGRHIEEMETGFLGGGRCRTVRSLCGPQLAGWGLQKRRSLRLHSGAEAALKAGLERHNVLGRVIRIVVAVTRPYTGPDPNPLLDISLHAGRQRWNVMSLSLQRVGRAESTVKGIETEPGPAMLARLSPDLLARYVEIGCQSRHRPVNGSAEQMPELTIELELEPIAAQPRPASGRPRGVSKPAGRRVFMADRLLQLAAPNDATGGRTKFDGQLADR